MDDSPANQRGTALAYLGDLRPAFVAHLAERLANQIGRQCEVIHSAAGIRAPSRTHSVMLYLAEHGPASLTEIARLDGQSHQLLATRLGPLERMKLVERVDDPVDARRRPYRLTAAGRREVPAIRESTRHVATAMQGLSAQLGIDLMAVLEQAGTELRRQPLAERVDAQEE